MPQKGVYDLFLRYAAPSGQKFNFVFVNDLNAGSVQFVQSATFREANVGKVFLKQGANTIAVVKEWGYIDIDNIRVEPSSALRLPQNSNGVSHALKP